MLDSQLCKIDMKIFAENFRGFKQIEIDLNKINFLVGDNSSGKSSLLHLVDAVLRTDLSTVPRLNEDFAVGEYDYFSPYFKNADVTFGFSVTSRGTTYSKIITVTKGGHTPIVKSCTYFTDELAVTVKQVSGGYLTRVVKKHGALGYKDRLALHKSKKGLILNDRPPSGISVNETSALFAFFKFDAAEEEEFISVIFNESLPVPRMISPLRALPEKFYSLSRKINSKGSHFAAMWLDISRARGAKVISDVEAFGLESGLFESIKVREVAKSVPDSPLVVSVVKNEREFFLNQVGVGVSQVVPVLIDTIFSTVDGYGVSRPILIQQPELHLHPVAQAALGSFFYNAAARKGVRGILETHSSFLIDRFRAELRDHETDGGVEFSSSDVTIIFCENSAEGNVATLISMAPDGSLKNEPDQYHQFFVNELMRTMF